MRRSVRKRKGVVNSIVDNELEDKKNKLISKIEENVENDNGQVVAEIDQSCFLHNDRNYHVYISGKDIYSVMLNQTNIANNNNKFFLIQLLESTDKKYSVWLRWGRVGYNGQRNLVSYEHNLNAAKTAFENKFFDKTKNNFLELENFVHVRGKYDLIKVYHKKCVKEAESPMVASKLEERLFHALELICSLEVMAKSMSNLSYDLNRCPLGSITKEQVKEGFEELSKIEKFIMEKNFKQDYLCALNDYYTRIPHSFKMSTPPRITSLDELKHEIELLETMAQIEIAVSAIADNENNFMHRLDHQYEKLKFDIKVLDSGSRICELVSNYLKMTHGSTHDWYTMKLKNLFELTPRNKKQEVANKKYRKKIGNRKLLWHGSRLSNWYGILSEGLRIAPPEAPVTGYMFGKGIYFADVSSKSANYTYPESSKSAFIVLSEVALGTPIDLEKEDVDASSLPAGKHSVRGIGQFSPDSSEHVVIEDGLTIPCGKLLKSQENAHLIYNEYVIYDLRQIRERFLVEVEFEYTSLL